MLIGSVLQLPFGGYVRQAVVPVVIGLVMLWVWLAYGPGAGDLHPPSTGSGQAKPLPAAGEEAMREEGVPEEPPFDRWQTAKGLVVAGALLVIFLFTDWPRDVAALVGAGLLLLSRRLHSSRVLGLIDWPLLLLFMGLFVVNHAFETTGLAAQAVAWLGAQGVHLANPGPLLVASAVLSNLVSNVPAVMLLLPHLGGSGEQAGVMLALVTTFAGNLLLVGSIANLIVADLARQQGVELDWKRHAVTGIPVTLATLAVVWGWMRFAS